ncbi:hypothetical protein TNCV_576941 [Trichonephila clavipes]|nr:hypothetical protein TNCV_576941 [Trichonephila clavipes]
MLEDLSFILIHTGGRGSLVVKFTHFWLVCLEFEPNAVEDSSCRGSRCTLNLSRLKRPPVGVVQCGSGSNVVIVNRSGYGVAADEGILCALICKKTATAGSDVVQSGRPIFDDFFHHLWPYIGNNTANVVFQMVKRLWLIRIDQ